MHPASIITQSIFLSVKANQLFKKWKQHIVLTFFFSSAYQNNDIDEFEKILQRNKQNIMEDPFIREHIEGRYISAHFVRYNVLFLFIRILLIRLSQLVYTRQLWHSMQV